MFEEMSRENDDERPPAEAALPESARTLADWKQKAREEFERWLAGIDEIPEDPSGPDTGEETPDLFSFYQELTALRNEVRKANRRTVDTFTQFGESLQTYGDTLGALGESVASAIPKQPEASSDICLGLIEIHDRLSRLSTALDQPPPPRRLFSATAEWEKAWDNLRQAFAIVSRHAENLLRRAGVEPVSAAAAPFDPRTMVAVAVETESDLPPNTVAEVVTPGYTHHGKVLRLAEVTVTPRENPTAH